MLRPAKGAILFQKIKQKKQTKVSNLFESYESFVLYIWYVHSDKIMTTSAGVETQKKYFNLYTVSSRLYLIPVM